MRSNITEEKEAVIGLVAKLGGGKLSNGCKFMLELSKKESWDISFKVPLTRKKNHREIVFEFLKEFERISSKEKGRARNGRSQAAEISKLVYLMNAGNKFGLEQKMKETTFRSIKSHLKRRKKTESYGEYMSLHSQLLLLFERQNNKHNVAFNDKQSFYRKKFIPERKSKIA